MTEAKKTGRKRTKSAQNADLVEMAAATTAEVVEKAAAATEAVQAPAPVLPSAEAGPFFASVREQGDALRQAVREAAAVSAQGVLEVNDKIIDALHNQSHAALDLWRNAVTSPDPQAVFQTQAQAARQAYATASAQWKDIAETTTRWMARSFEPLQSALHHRAR